MPCYAHLSNATPNDDIRMFQKVFFDPAHQWDMLKIYICLDSAFTRIRDWKLTGKWKPYSEEGNGEELEKVLTYILKNIPPWIRINRFNRDIPESHPSNNFNGYLSKNIRSNIYQILTDRLSKKNIFSNDIRSREIKNITSVKKIKKVERSYFGSGGKEYFISLECPYSDNLYNGQKIDYTPPDNIIGYVRLRIPNSNKLLFSNSKDEISDYLPNDIKDTAC